MVMSPKIWVQLWYGVLVMWSVCRSCKNFPVSTGILIVLVLIFAKPTSSAEISIGNSKDNCDLVILGEITQGDEDKFRRNVRSILESGCGIPRINIYSPGGSYGTAVEIANDVQFLHAITVAPKMTYSKKGVDPQDDERSCDLMPGEEERRKREHQKLDAHMPIFQKALREGKPLPKNPAHLSTFDPRSGRGDSGCICASACFFIWIAGAERQGDVVVVHRPYFDPTTYKTLEMAEARAAFLALTRDARKFLSDLETPSDIVDKVFSTPSDKAIYLSRAELTNLRTAAYYGELKIATCGAEPGQELTLPSDAFDKYEGRYKALTPAERRRLLKLAEREICWRDSQAEVRRKINSAFLRKYAP